MAVQSAATTTSGTAVYARRVPEDTILAVPAFVERELTRYLECGILAYGFVRVRCSACRYDRVVAFSCKGRGFCPSCGGRRMADTAAFLVDHILPAVPVRQWVLSLPIALRYKLAYDSKLTAEVLQLFVRSVFASLRRRARPKYGFARCDCGSFDSRRLESHRSSSAVSHPMPTPRQPILYRKISRFWPRSTLPPCEAESRSASAPV